MARSQISSSGVKNGMLSSNGNNITQTGSTDIGSNFSNHGVIDGTVLNSDSIKNIIYPSYLSQDEYANRRVTFIATEKSTSHYDTDSIASKTEIIKSSFSEGMSAFKSAVSEATGGSSDSILGQSNTFFDMLTKACITLPLPNSFQENLSHSWNKTEGMIASALSGAINSKVQSMQSNGKGGKGVAKVISGLDLTKATGAFADSLGIRKPMLNPNYWQNYTGTDPRGFGFEIEFIPQSQAEAKIVKDVIKTFKAYSSPELIMGSVSVLSPHYWNIIISNAEITDMYRMDNLVLTQISIDYSADGKMALHGDGMPKYIKMNLNFTESHVTYMQNYQDSFETWISDRNSQMTNSSAYYGGENNAEKAKAYGLSVKPKNRDAK